MSDGTTRAYGLDGRLPADVLVGGDAPWSRYRQYPVFSARWLGGRSLLFAAVIGAFACVVAFGTGFVARDYGVGALAGGHLFAAFLLMATAGPALATWVRHRGWPERRERVGVVVAVLAGIAVSFVADQWASARVAGAVPVDAGQARAVAAVRGGERWFAFAINVVVLVAVYALFGGGLALRAYFSERRRWAASRAAQELQSLRLAKQAAEVRLGVLQAQVEPHFLFNTLASVRALVHADPALAEATLDALVAHLRATIPHMRAGDGAFASTLGQQLDICASYLEVMRLRTGGRLDYAIDVDAPLRALPLPPLLLITLVENAVKHGVEPRPGPGRIELHAEVHAQRLRVHVRDDGAGLLPGAGGGLGLANVRAQLAARYGDRATLRLQSHAPRGTIATLDLPRDAPADDDDR